MLSEAFHRSSLKEDTVCVFKELNTTTGDVSKFVWAKIMSFPCKADRLSGERGLPTKCPCEGYLFKMNITGSLGQQTPQG